MKDKLARRAIRELGGKLGYEVSYDRTWGCDVIATEKSQELEGRLRKIKVLLDMLIDYLGLELTTSRVEFKPKTNGKKGKILPR